MATLPVLPGADPRPTLEMANPGDVVLFLTGGHKRVKAFGKAAGGRFDGQPGNPVTLKFEPGAYISLESAGSPLTADGKPATTGEGVNLEGCSDIVIDGPAVERMTFGARTYIAGIRAVEGARITLRNATVSGCRTWGGFFGFVDDILVEDCLFEGSLQQHGLYLSNSFRGALVRQVVTRNNNGCGVHVNGDDSAASTTGKPHTGIAEDIRIEDVLAEGNGAGGGAAFNLDGVDGAVLLRVLANGNKAAALTLFRGDGAIPTRRVTVLHSNLNNPTGSRATLMVNDGAGPLVLWNTRVYNPDPNRPEVVCPVAMYERGDYNEVSRFHESSDASVRTLDAWKTLTRQDANSAPHPGPVPTVPVGVPDPVASAPRYAAKDLIVSIPATVVMTAPTPISAKLTNTGSATWRRVGSETGMVKVGLLTPGGDNDHTYGLSRLLLVEDEVPPGATGTFAGTMNTTVGGTAIFRAVAELVEWFGPKVEADVHVVLPPPPTPTDPTDLGPILERLNKIEQWIASPAPPPVMPAAFTLEVLAVTPGEPGALAVVAVRVRPDA